MSSVFSFSGHETFPLRVGWLKKAVEAVHDDPEIFRSDDAIAEFGVGKNMVRSIRHWGYATGVLKEHSEIRYAVEVTDFGEYLFGDEGRDPYCEDPATVWLLHWQLCRVPQFSTLWHFIFGHSRSTSLELGTVLSSLKQWLVEQDVQLPSNATLKRDFQCLVNTYAPPRRGQDLEDSLSCPFASLGLVQEREGLLFIQDYHKILLPAEILAYSILDYWERTAPKRDSLSIEDILNKNTSPGRIFILNEDWAFELISKIDQMKTPPFEYQDSAGIRQLIRMNKQVDKETILNWYYENTESKEFVVEVGV